jgi:uncharacterized protein YkwD
MGMGRYPEGGTTGSRTRDGFPRARGMRRTPNVLARIALVATLVVGLLATAGPAAANARSEMYRATNRTRVHHEIRRLDLRHRISRLARRHSVAMARRGSIFHTHDPVRRYLDGIRWRVWGENVGVTSGSIAGLQQAFLDSPSHRANILDRRFRRVAVGAYRDGDGLLWVTIFFYG